MRSADASRIVGEALAAAFARLAGFPRMGHERADLTERSVRFWGVFSYLIVYDPAARPINIVRVIHAARDLRSVRL